MVKPRPTFPGFPYVWFSKPYAYRLERNVTNLNKNHAYLNLFK